MNSLSGRVRRSDRVRRDIATATRGDAREIRRREAETMRRGIHSGKRLSGYINAAADITGNRVFIGRDVIAREKVMDCSRKTVRGERFADGSR